MGRSGNGNGVTSSPGHIVLADDNARETGVLSWLLRERGYEVVSVRLGDQVIDACRRHPVDLVLMGANGPTTAETLKRLRADDRARDIPVIVAGVNESESAESLKDAADDWLPRPLSVTELLARISAQLKASADMRAIRRELSRRDTELRRAHEEIATTRQLVEILNEVTAELTASEIYRVLARRVARALDLKRCSVVLATAGEETATVVATFDDPAISNLRIQLDRYPEFQAALRSGRPVLVEDVQDDPMFAEARELWKREGRAAPVKSVLTIPFSLERKRGGVFFLRTERGERVLTAEDSDFAEVVIRAAVAAIKRAQALETTRADNRRLEELATTDALTRLLNRRALLERLGVEVDRARRFQSQLSLLMVDLDHFKSVNDKQGHLVGDGVLRQTGTLLAGLVRTIDVVARYGGEEFVVILPETAHDGAVTFAERLRRTVAEHRFEADAGRGFNLTCSVGVATFPSPRVASTEDLFARADEALYRAKSGGRNQVRS